MVNPSSNSSRPANLEDIARKAGVSRSTVSRVINNEPYVSEATRQRVQAVIREEGYSPNPAARMLVTQRTRVIGVVIPHTLQIAFQDPFYFPTLLQGVADTTYSNDYATLLWWGQSREHEERFAHKIIQQNRLMDGLIVASATSDDVLIGRLVEIGTPFVMVERPTRYLDEACFVSVDNVAAAQTAVKHLIDLGRTRIAHLTGSLDNTDGLDRLTGYRMALEAAGLPYDPSLVVEGRFSQQTGAAATRRLLRQEFDALFVGNDMMAIAAINVLNEAGVRVPDDVAVVGFDDLPQAAQTTPQLTTVRQPIQYKGNVATKLLIDLIEGRLEAPQQILLPTQLVIRQSCGAMQL